MKGTMMFKGRSCGASVMRKVIAVACVVLVALSFFDARSLAEGAETDVQTSDTTLNESPLTPLASSTSGVVLNERSGEYYGDVVSAVDSSQEGDKLVMQESYSFDGTLEVSRGVTLDLNGHELSIRAGKDASSSAGTFDSSKAPFAALSFTGGTSKLVDSKKQGLLRLEVGSSVETNVSARNVYRGIAVTNGSSLNISSSSVQVCYTGDSIIKPAVTLHGIEVAQSSLVFENSAELEVCSSATAGAFGATNVAGVYMSSAQSSKTSLLDIKQGCSVKVENQSAAVVSGYTDYSSSSSGTNSETNAELIELDTSSSPELMSRINEQFRYSAAYDSSVDKAGNVYNTSIYYAYAMEVTEALSVWAFSDQIGDAEAGYPSALEVKHVLVRSDYQQPLDAWGVASDTDFSGKVNVSGAVSAKTTSGHAIDVYQSNMGQWSVSSSKLEASCASEPYRMLAGNLDLREMLGCTNIAERVVYPKKASYRSVEQVFPQAHKTLLRGQESETNAGPITAQKLWGGNFVINDPVYSVDTIRDTGISFVYYRKTATGYLYTSEVISDFDRTQNAISLANERVKVGDTLTIDNVEYRFRGWSLRSSDKEPLFTTSLPGVPEKGINQAGVNYYAIYEHSDVTVSVNFYADDGLFASVDDVSAAKTIAEVLSESGHSDNPSSPREGVSFLGWNTKPGGRTYLYANLRTLASVADGSSTLDLYAIWSDGVEEADDPEELGESEEPVDNSTQQPPSSSSPSEETNIGGEEQNSNASLTESNNLDATGPVANTLSPSSGFAQLSTLSSSGAAPIERSSAAQDPVQSAALEESDSVSAPASTTGASYALGDTHDSFGQDSQGVRIGGMVTLIVAICFLALACIANIVFRRRARLRDELDGVKAQQEERMASKGIHF